ncbi:MAG: hypothetical protein M1829_005179 [Trizodia sp. TS-e1964]|nr:MAG: hypothetical protein M1829_005179 [Trizodia sp. TS-e1964]
MLSQAKESPDINNCLTVLFASPQAPPEWGLSTEDYHSVRCAAAIMLKNNIKTSYSKISESSLTYIRTSILIGLSDSNAQIRNFTGNVITELVHQGGILGWPQLLPDLLLLVGNEKGNVQLEAQEGAMGALLKVCEDNRKQLDKDYQGQRPLNFIIPKLLEFAASQNPTIRADALSAIVVFVPLKSQALLASIDPFLEILFRLVYDPSDKVRRNVCRAFVQIAEIEPAKIQPYMGGLVDFIISQQRMQENEELALDAAEFWLCVSEHDKLRESLGPYLGKIVPILLECMVYCEDDILTLEGGEDDADEEDKLEDIKPQFAKGKAARTLPTINSEATTSNNTNGLPVQTITGYAFEEDELSEGEIDEYGDDDGSGDPEDRWNLRKCSAAALDVLSSVFHEPVFEAILPYLKDNLRHPDWQFREAAVLALGAVAEGCMHSVTPHLPELIPYLIALLDDKEPLVRQITCWTLGRYSGWASHLADPAQIAQYFEPMMDGILKKMLDSNKRVQEAGASAFAHLEEKAMDRLVPYCEPIIRQFVQCFARYKDRNMFILYDCVQTLAEHVSEAIARPNLVQLLMPALMARWERVSDQSREIFPLLECLSYVAAALGSSFAEFAPPIFSRCVNIIFENLRYHAMAANNQAMDIPDKDFLVTSLDLLSAIVQAIESSASYELISKSSTPFFELICYCMEDSSTDVRQSSYALLGDCAIYVPKALEGNMDRIMAILLRQIDVNEVIDEQTDVEFAVVNNACWSVGEVAVHQAANMQPYVETMYTRLLNIIQNPEVPSSLHENAALALGRLGHGCSQQMSSHIAEFAPFFLDTMKNVDNSDEKASALHGFTMVVLANPSAIEGCITDYFQAIAHYRSVTYPPTEASQMLYPWFQEVCSNISHLNFTSQLFEKLHLLISN